MSDEDIKNLITNIENNCLVPTAISISYNCAECKDKYWVMTPDNRVTECLSCSGERINERLKKLLSTAEIPPHFAGFNFASYPKDGDQAAKAKIHEWSLINSYSSLYIYGKIGSGKTGLAVSALRQRILVFETKSLFINYVDFLRRLRQGMSDHTSDILLEKIMTVPLLLIDDLGAAAANPWRDETGFVAFGARHDAHLPTIFTSNFSLRELVEEKAIDVRTAARINESCSNRNYPDGTNKWIVGTAPETKSLRR